MLSSSIDLFITKKLIERLKERSNTTKFLGFGSWNFEITPSAYRIQVRLASSQLVKVKVERFSFLAQVLSAKRF